jgi:DnaJ-class molecular chaperone
MSMTWTEIRCWDCGGHGQVSSYTADGGDFLSADECRTCNGSGGVFRSAAGVLVQYPGGPFLGRESRWS